MKLAIIRNDNTVYVDGVPRAVDCSVLPADVHAIQWDAVAGHGEIEYAPVRCATCGSIGKKPNQALTDIAPYQAMVDAWNAAAKEGAGAS